MKFQETVVQRVWRVTRIEWKDRTLEGKSPRKYEISILPYVFEDFEKRYTVLENFRERISHDILGK